MPTPSPSEPSTRVMETSKTSGEGRISDLAFIRGFGHAYEAILQAFVDDLRAHAGQLILKVMRHHTYETFELAQLDTPGGIVIHHGALDQSAPWWSIVLTGLVGFGKPGRLNLNWIKRGEVLGISIRGTADLQRHQELGLLPGQSGWRTEFRHGHGDATSLYVGDDAVTTFFRSYGHAPLVGSDTSAVRALYRLATLIGDPLTRTVNLRHLHDVAQVAELHALEEDVAQLILNTEGAMTLTRRMNLGRTLEWMEHFGLNDHAAVKEARRILAE